MSVTKNPASDWVPLHQERWDKKPGLRFYYETQIFDRIISNVSDGPTLQLGAGPGFLSDYYPHMVNIDLGNRVNIDVETDAHALPFQNEAFSNIVGVDVLHHFACPGQALGECMRVLKGGGRLVIVEPWAGPVGNLFYKLIHHEECTDIENVWDLAFDPASKSPMEGNSRIPKLLFDSQIKYFHQYLPGVKIQKMEYFGGLSFLLTGGFQRFGFSENVIRSLVRLESLIGQNLMRALALRVLIVLQKES
jgi:SAM-dependent methyltransferase